MTRAENKTGARGYLQVRVMTNGIRVHAMAHRLVWRHFMGEIPAMMLINHKNGIKTDNRLENLEVVTPSENVIHARKILRVGRLDQAGEKNCMTKLKLKDVQAIRARRGLGEPLKKIATDYNISFQSVSKIAKGQRWACDSL